MNALIIIGGIVAIAYGCAIADAIGNLRHTRQRTPYYVLIAGGALYIFSYLLVLETMK